MPPTPPRDPPSPGRSPRIRPCWGGAGRGRVRPLHSIHTPSMEKGSRDPSSQPDTWMSPPPPSRSSGEEKGGLKDQASFLLHLPLLRDGPRPPPSLRADPPRLAGPRTAGQGAGGRGEGARAWLLYRQLGAAQGVRAARGGSRWAGMGGAGLCRGVGGGTPWHVLANLGTALLGFSPPTAEEPPGEGSGESELQEHEAGLPCACLSPGHVVAWALLPHLPQR